eukprot:gb/GFBE01000751.1/.p1 GENE.gb/GFBE01000751.1/~~gb/GFBE01000751.1/.p1  ORF type:complete len:279 (+),score=60.63 gb/GFBE01000751.1/:1-837(+)
MAAVGSHAMEVQYNMLRNPLVDSPLCLPHFAHAYGPEIDLDPALLGKLRKLWLEGEAATAEIFLEQEQRNRQWLDQGRQGCMPATAYSGPVDHSQRRWQQPAAPASAPPKVKKCAKGSMVCHDEGRYKVMLRNIPARCRVEELEQAIDDVGFTGCCATYNMPVKSNTCMNRGYAFATFNELDTAASFAEAINGYRFRSRLGSKAIQAELPEIQDLDAAQPKRIRSKGSSGHGVQGKAAPTSSAMQHPASWPMQTYTGQAEDQMSLLPPGAQVAGFFAL